MTKESSYREISCLRDFDWKLQCILGSSSLANYQKNQLTLDFHVCEPNALESKAPRIKETVSVELNQDELEKLIAVLESCLDKFKIN